MVFVGSRNALPLDLLEQGVAGQGWDEFEKKLLLPKEHVDRFEPNERVAKILYAISRSADGRELVEWLMDVTLRQSVRITGDTIEQTALRAAQLQGIHGVGEVILQAMAKGEKLLNQNGAGR